MTTGWPQNQQDLRWPYSDAEDAGPGRQAGGRVATDSDRSDRSADPGGGFGTEHPSGPLPVTRSPEPRGRFGRGKSRDGSQGALGPDDGPADDADYDWIRYLGEAGPAQEHSKRPADAQAANSGEREASGRRTGKLRSRRHAAPEPPSAETETASFPAAGAVGRRGRPDQPEGRLGPDRPAQASPAQDRQAIAPSAGSWRSADIPPAAAFPPDAAVPPSAASSPGILQRRPLTGRPAPEADPLARPARSEPEFRAPSTAQPGPSRHRLSQPDTAATAAWPARTAWPDQAPPDAGRRRPVAPGPGDARLSPPDASRRAEDGRGPDSGARSRPGTSAFERPERSAQQLQHAQDESGAALAAAGRAAAQSASDQQLGIDRLAARTAGHGKAAREAKRDRKARRAAGREGRAKRSPAPDAAGASRPASARPVAASLAAASAVAASATAVSARTSDAAPVRTAPVKDAPVRTAPVKEAPVRTSPAKDAPAKSRKAARRKVRHPVRLVVGGGVAAAVAVGAVVVTEGLGGSTAVTHSISTPSKLQAYVQDPALATGMGAQALRAEIVKKGNGEASHVVDAVYEDTTGAAAKSGPLILLFVGGNLSGSAGSFITSFTGLLHGAFVINPGSLGGQAACVPGVGGHPAECAWADGDTFGLIASPTVSAAALGKELRSVRPLVEHTAKKS